MTESTWRKTQKVEGGQSFVDADSEAIVKNAEKQNHIALEAIEPADENEAVVLRALRAKKKIMTVGFLDKLSPEEQIEVKWMQSELRMDKHPEYQRALFELLNKYAETINIGDAEYFFEIHGFPIALDTVLTSAGGGYIPPDGFSDGEWLDIRRTLITRYLDEIPEDQDDPYNSPVLWYNFLIRPEIYPYLRGEDVRFVVGGAIEGHGSQEQARPERAAYVRAILKDTLEHLDDEKAIVVELKQLKEKYPQPESGYISFHFVHPYKSRDGIHGGYIEVQKMKSGLRENTVEKVLETIRPRLPMIASQFDVIR